MTLFDLLKKLDKRAYTKNDRDCSFLKDVSFSTKDFKELTDDELKACAELFSNHYGTYSSEGIPEDNYAFGKEGKQIRFSAKKYKIDYWDDNYYISMAHYKEQLIAHAIYFRKHIAGEGYMSWIVQLVVHSGFTNCGIASRLLHSAWGFSSDVAWGLATSNPLTVKTLESATFRSADPKMMEKHRDKIEKIAKYIPFAKDAKITITDDTAIIDTGFYVSHDKLEENKKKYKSEWKLGDLPEGHEWLAFTFKSQEIDLTNENNKKNFDKMIEFHEAILNEAYSRMKMEKQPWTKGTVREIEYILSQANVDKNSIIADFGCGIGRHIIELANRGYMNLYGFDFSESNVLKAKAKAKEMNLDFINFAVKDSRNNSLKEKADLILCLYDVIGSYHDDSDNRSILKNIYNNLSAGGTAVVSVMNMELTKNMAKHKVKDIRKEPKEIFNLKASGIMQRTGNIFDPEHYLIDEKTNLVYRKEEFSGDGKLSAEYVIRDRRYDMKEIKRMAKECGFVVAESRYVQAGKFDIALKKGTDTKAKEILLVLKKP